MSRTPRWLQAIYAVALLVLLIVGGWAVYHYNVFGVRTWLHEVHCLQTAGKEKTFYKTKTVTKTVTKPVTVESQAGKDCLAQQAALLAKATAETKAKVLAVINAWHRRHPHADDDWVALTAYVDNYKDDTLEGTVVFDITLPSGRVFHFEDARKVCICHAWKFHFTELPPPPKPRVIIQKVERHVEVITPIKPTSCFAIPFDGRRYENDWTFDGRTYPGVGPHLPTVLEFYEHGGAGENDMRTEAASDCFYAVDGLTHEVLKLVRGCIPCQQEQDHHGHVEHVISPRDVVIGTSATGMFTIVQKNGDLGFPSGYGTVYMDAWWARRVSMLSCFMALHWYNGPNGGWMRYYDYYNRVSLSEFVEDISYGHLRRTMIPSGILGYGQPLGLEP